MNNRPIFDPINRCIYCDRSDIELSDEHIMPYGLNGDLILPKSSCLKCAAITSKVERSVLRGSLLHLRTKNNFRTRRAKNRPASFDLLESEADGGGFREHSAGARRPYHEMPIAKGWVLPRFGEPGILTGKPPWEAAICIGSEVWMPNDEANGLLKLGGGRRTAIAFKVDPESFGRMIAKIAHSFTTGVLGYGSFKPFLNRIILETTGKLSHHIGSETQNGPTAPEDDYFSLGLHKLLLASGKYAAIVKVRVFSWLLTPVYYAVVGEITDVSSLKNIPNAYHKNRND